MQKTMVGTFSNKAQVNQEIAENIPDDEQHALTYQTFKPVVIPALEGVTVFLEASTDGTKDTVIGRGIYHAYADPESERILLSLKRFSPDLTEQEIWNKPDILRTITNEDLTWTEGCAFHLTFEADIPRVEGAMKEQSCFFGEGESKMNHHDIFELSETEVRSDGRFYDMDGNFIFGDWAEGPSLLLKMDTK